MNWYIYRGREADPWRQQLETAEQIKWKVKGIGWLFLENIWLKDIILYKICKSNCSYIFSQKITYYKQKCFLCF